MPESCECTNEAERCSAEKCDIFDFMARHVGMTVIHPGGFKATRKLLGALQLSPESRVLDIACGKGTSSFLLAENHGCNVAGIDLAGDLLGDGEQQVESNSDQQHPGDCSHNRRRLLGNSPQLVEAQTQAHQTCG